MTDPLREQTYERPLPNSSEAERAILGAILLDNGLIAQAIEWLKPEDFYVPSHRRIFVAMIALFEGGKEINPIFIGEELKKEGALDTVGGIPFITNLTYGLPHSTNIKHYAKVVRGKSMLRRLIKVTAKITNEALEEADDAETILDSAEQQIFALSDERIRGGFGAVLPIATAVLERIQEQEGRKVVLTGITSGFGELDERTSGFQRQDLILAAARPSVGKTAWASMLALNAAKAGGVVGICSLEMSKEALVMRLICANANIDMQRFRNGFLSKPEWALVAKSLAELAELKIFIDDASAISVLEARAKFMRLKAEQKRLDLGIIDYLQLMRGANSRPESRQQEVSQISRDCKAVAKELNFPLIAVSQLSRAPESRSDHRPQLSDLRDSGALEQDADMVAFLYQPEKHMTQEAALQSNKKNVTEIILAKNRNGPTGFIELRFTPSSMRFDNLYRER